MEMTDSLKTRGAFCSKEPCSLILGLWGLVLLNKIVDDVSCSDNSNQHIIFHYR